MAATRSSHFPEYKVWVQIRNRCMNPKAPNYKHYGGRGITMCERWRSFDAFVEDMGLRPIGFTIERKDVNGNYEPDNCKWASHSEQMLNRRPWVWDDEKVGKCGHPRERSEKTGIVIPCKTCARINIEKYRSAHPDWRERQRVAQARYAAAGRPTQ